MDADVARSDLLDVGPAGARALVGRRRRAGHVTVKQQEGGFDPAVHDQLRYAIAHLDRGAERGDSAKRHRRRGGGEGRGSIRSAEEAGAPGED
jgi:hypothetical protein